MKPFDDCLSSRFHTALEKPLKCVTLLKTTYFKIDRIDKNYLRDQGFKLAKLCFFLSFLLSFGREKTRSSIEYKKEKTHFEGELVMNLRPIKLFPFG